MGKQGLQRKKLGKLVIPLIKLDGKQYYTPFQKTKIRKCANAEVVLNAFGGSGAFLSFHKSGRVCSIIETSEAIAQFVKSLWNVLSIVA